MPKLKWDESTKRLYETGVNEVALYVQNSDGSYANGVAWNGVTAINENPSGAEETALYADNIKYLSLRSAEEFGATIEAYTYPDEFAACNGEAELTDGVVIGQQPRVPFALVYKTRIGNDTEADAHGFKLHVVYNCTAAPSAKDYATINDSPEAITMSWEISSTPVEVDDTHRPTATVVIDSTKFTGSAKKAKLDALLETIYGGSSTEPSLPHPAEILAALTGDES